MATFVVRATNHPAEDLKRNWSAEMGGGELGAFQSREDAIAYWKQNYYDSRMPEFRFHPAYNGFVQVHYEGLGAFQLQAEDLNEAIEEAKSFDEFCACVSEAGDGHFYASDVVAYYEVKEGIYVFELK